MLSCNARQAVYTFPPNILVRSRNWLPLVRHTASPSTVTNNYTTTIFTATRISNICPSKLAHIRYRVEDSLKAPQRRAIMSSDDAYSSFLDQANQDTGADKASVQSKSKSVSAKAVDTDIPATLQKVEQYYTSEADEPFEPVSLKWSGKNMPSESTLCPSNSSCSYGAELVKLLIYINFRRIRRAHWYQIKGVNIEYEGI